MIGGRRSVSLNLDCNWVEEFISLTHSLLSVDIKYLERRIFPPAAEPLTFVIYLAIVPSSFIRSTFSSMDTESTSIVMTPERFPRSIIALTAFSGIVCLPMIALSAVNYGALSIWLNALIAFLIIVHHLSFSIIAWTRRKHLAQVNKAIMLIAPVDEVSAILAPHPIAYDLWNILSLGFLFIINSISFGIMVDITTNGPIKSTLPAERVGSHKWNLKIQYGQVAVLAVELVLLGAMIFICWFGRARVIEAQDNLQEEIDYDMMEAPMVS